MNSPTNNLGFIHQARYMPRSNPTSNVYLVKNPVLMHHPASYSTIPPIHTPSKIVDNRIKLIEDNKLSTRNTPSKRIQQKYFHAEPRTSQISQCSIKQILQANSQDEIKTKLSIINDKIASIFTKLANHEQKIKELSIKQQNSQKQKQIEKIQNAIWKAVEKQINQSQQHFMVQNRLITSDIETLKLELMCFANKKQVNQLAEKCDLSEKSTKNAIKQLEQRLKNESQRISQRRKSDVELFQKQIEEMRAKMMEIVFDQQNREANNQVCLVKCLSFKILHQMKVYNEDQLQWMDLGTGEAVYGLDEQGYLLDSQSKYITNPNGDLIKLDASHIEILKKHGLTR